MAPEQTVRSINKTPYSCKYLKRCMQETGMSSNSGNTTPTARASSSGPQHSIWRNTELSNDISLSDDEFDEFDESEEIATPDTVRGSSRLIGQNNRLYKNGPSAFLAHLDRPTGSRTPTKSQSIGDNSRSGEQVSENSENHVIGFSHQESVAFTPNRKLIGDDNELTPVAFNGSLSPPREDIFNNGKASNKDMHFDPSDRESPERLTERREISSSVSENKSDGQTSKNSAEKSTKSSEKSPKASEPPLFSTSKATDSELKKYTQIPSRSSPLRNEIKKAPEPLSAAVIVIEKFRNSGALVPKSDQEIRNQINSSLMELKEADLDRISDSDGDLSVSDSQSESDSNSSLESDENELLDYLDKFVSPEGAIDAETLGQWGPAVGNEVEMDVQNEVEESEREVQNEVQNAVHNKIERDVEIEEHGNEDILNEAAEFQITASARANLTNDLIDIADSSPSDGSPKQRVPKNRTLRTGKLSGKYARKKVTEQKKNTGIPKYKDWSSVQWGKLQRLVDSDVPDNVIINSPIVLRDLKCKNKQELALRVEFLVKNKLDNNLDEQS